MKKPFTLKTSLLSTAIGLACLTMAAAECTGQSLTNMDLDVSLSMAIDTAGWQPEEKQFLERTLVVRAQNSGLGGGDTLRIAIHATDGGGMLAQYDLAWGQTGAQQSGAALTVNGTEVTIDLGTFTGVSAFDLHMSKLGEAAQVLHYAE